MEIGIGKDLVCSCGLLNRLCSVFIRFGAAVTIDLEMHIHGDTHHNNSTMLLASDK